MTSLARQLERLAIPGQPSLRQLVSKKRPSLLFDRREAADMDPDTFFSLGRNGLEELIGIDPTFAQFEDSLFQESSKEFERSVQTPDVLDELDRNVSVFLRRLSPYLLLKPAQKCLEWLLHAYRVHSCNVDAVVECVLPYYETKLFARVVQLLPLKSPSSRWRWLRPLQKAGSPLSRLALVQHCLSDLSFLVFVCEMVPRAVALHKRSPSGSLRSVLAFYCSTVVLVLETDSAADEEVVGRLLPYLLKGLKSRVMEYRAASYVIAGQLASKTSLEERVSTSLLAAVTKHLGSDLSSEALCCAAIFCHNQNITKLSSKTVRNLLGVSNLPSLLSSLTSSHDISPLLKLLLSTLISAHFSNHGDEVAMEMIMSVLDEVPLKEDVVLALIRELLETFVSECVKRVAIKEEEEEEGEGEEKMESLKSSVATLAQSLDTKYPQLMDRALQTALVDMAATRERRNHVGDTDEEGEGEGGEGEEGEREGEEVKWIQEFVSVALPGSRHQLVRKGRRGKMGGEGTLVLSVHHPEPSVREAAVRQLGKLLRHKAKKGGLHDSEFVSSCLVSRLRDDEPGVVAAVLELGGNMLTRHVPTELLLPPLSSILAHPNLPLAPSPWQDVATSALSLLTSPPLSKTLLPDQLDDIVITSLPLLFVHRRGNRLAGGVASVLSSTDHVLLSGLKELMRDKDWRSGCSSGSERDSEALAAANSSLVCHLGSRLAQIHPSTRHNLVNKMFCKATSSSPDSPAHFLFIGILGVAMEMADSAHSLYWLQQALSLLRYTRDGIAELAESPPHTLPSPIPTLPDLLRPLVRKNVRTSQAHSMLLLWLLDAIVTHLPTVKVSAEMWLGVPREDNDETDEQGLYHSALLSLFSLLTSSLLHDWAPRAAQHLLCGLLKVHLSNRRHLVRFLAMIWTAPVVPDDPPPPGCVSVATQASSLAVFFSYLKCLPPESLVALTTQLCPVVPSLLIPLTSPYLPIRHQTLTCLSLLQTSPAHLPPTQPSPAYSTTPLLFLLDTLADSELSLTSDPSFLPHLLGQLFSADPAHLAVGRRGAAKKEPGLRKRGVVLDGLLRGILTHAVALSPPPHIQVSLLRILTHVDSELKVSATQPLLQQLLDKCSTHSKTPPTEGEGSLTSHEVETLRLCLAGLTPHLASGFLETFLQSSDTHLSFQLLLGALSLTTPLGPTHPSPFVMALQQVTPAFFAALPAVSLKINLFNSLLSLITTTQRSEVAAMVKNCIRKLELGAELVTEVLTGLSSCLGDPPVTPGRKKQRHTKEVEPCENSLTNEQGHPRGWRGITVLLELLQDSSSSVTDSYLLTPHYFALLSRCLQAEESERLQLEYTQQLILGGLLSICKQLTSQGIEEARALMPESVFNMELVVQCVRLSSNPLTHHHALLLLSSATALYPSRVLHNIMPVFTFMGSSLLRSDDQYSFQVITQTLDSVLPVLIQSGSSVLPSLSTPQHATTRSTSHRRPRPQTTPTTSTDVVTEIVRVFIDAVPHVPDHRRLPLLSHLLLRVGPAHFLSVALGLLLTKHVEQLGVKEQTPKEALVTGGFPVSVAQLFCVELQLQAVGQLLSYTTSLPVEKPHSVSGVRQLPAEVNRIFNVATHSQKQMQQFKVSSFSLISSVLSHRRLAEQVSCVATDSIKSVETNIHSILQGSLDYETVVSAHKPTPQSKNSSQKLHLSLVSKISDVIGHATALLTPGSLVAMVMHLLGVASEEVKTKALKIVARKLEEGKSYFTSDQDECLVELLGVVVGVAGSDSSHLLTRHSAVYCVKLLARRLGHNTYHSHLTQALEGMLSLLSHSDSLSSELTGSCLLAVAEISSSLGPHLIPHLPPSLPPVIDRLAEGVGVMVQTAAVTTLGVIVQTLPKFLSSFAATIVEKLCWLERREGEVEGKERAQLAKEASLTREKVAKLVPGRTLVPVYAKVYHLLCSLGKGPLLALLEMVELTVSSLTGEEARSLAAQLGDLFSLCLNHRAQHKQLVSLEDLDEVEGKCVEAFTQLVVHLSESVFRPMFLKFLSWATKRGADEDRLVAFYHLTDGVAGKLKGLFLLFAGHIVKNAASLLERTHQDHQENPVFQSDPLAAEKTSVLLSHLLSCLHKIFLHSQPNSSSSFLTRERFDTLMTPLVHQISNQVGGVLVFQRRVENLLCPCVAQLAVAAGREELWKPLNHQLLLTTRHKRPEVRYAVVVVLKEVYSRLGNEFMTLLPETIPFLAELLEDESEEVEQGTQSLISTIESHIGESIQQYFT